MATKWIWLVLTFALLLVAVLIIRRRRAVKGVKIMPNEFRSNILLGLLLKANPFCLRLRVDHVGVYLERRPWHGLIVRRNFFPMNLIKTVSTAEILGCIARIEIVLNYSSNIPTLIKIPRFFSAKDARLFFQQWVHLSQVHV